MRNTTASDIMTREVITVHPDTDIEELGSVLSEKRISGAPVLDEKGELFGIVTEMDLIRQNSRLHIPTVFRIFDANIVFEKPGRMLDEMKRMAATKVRDICTRKVITISPDTSVVDIASRMSDEDVHLLPVMEGGRLAGIVGKVDLLRALSHSGEKD